MIKKSTFKKVRQGDAYFVSFYGWGKGAEEQWSSAHFFLTLFRCFKIAQKIRPRGLSAIKKGRFFS